MRGHRWFMTSYVVWLVAFLIWITAAWSAQVRVATYNIQFLSTDVVNQGDRLNKLRDVITVLDGHVIGLQEIADRAALELVFSPTEWHLVIDDDSTDVQDLAVAVRKPLQVVGLPTDLDADDEHFLFAHETETLFSESARFAGGDRPTPGRVGDVCGDGAPRQVAGRGPGHD